jgi:hypothetical protein
MGEGAAICRRNRPLVGVSARNPGSFLRSVGRTGEESDGGRRSVVCEDQMHRQQRLVEPSLKGSVAPLGELLVPVVVLHELV